ncbi:MAG: hypothetical protein Q8Q29_08375 [Actinomycetota bacterium]|jgi:hypothetical protein|nr:hypothetical protein [Actinomycetota bacterium]
MLPFVTPTTDMRRDEQRVTGQYRDRDSSRSVWQGVLILAVIFAAIVLAVALATSGDSGNQLEPTPTVQQQ